MKRLTLSLMLFGVAAILSLNSCSKAAVSNGAAALQAIKSDPTLTIFSTIESRSGDDALFINGYGYVIPTDSAFISVGITKTIAATYSLTSCDSIVRYYQVPNGISFANSMNTENSFGTSLNNQSVYGDSTSSKVYFNGIPTVSLIPVSSGNSVIYKVTQMLYLPVYSITQITATDPTLSLFNEAYNVTNLANSFTGISYTLFAPTNAAFMNAGYPDIASIDAANTASLKNILLYHIVPFMYFINDISLLTSLPTLQTENITVNPNGGNLQLLGNSDPTLPASIVSTSQLTNNVVIYKINQLLLP